MKKIFKVISVVVITLILAAIICKALQKDVEVIDAERYVVSRGDTLWDIAKTRINKNVDIRDYIGLIYENNEGLTPYIKPGQVITLPVLSGMKTKATEEDVTENTKYTSLETVEVSKESVETDIIEQTSEACDRVQNFDMTSDYGLLMAESISVGDYELAKHYESLQNEKKAYLGIQDDITFDDLLLLSKIVYAEAGSSWLSEAHRQMVASVVINRVNSPEFPDTIYDVVWQEGQYSAVGTEYFDNLKPSRASVFSALKILVNGSILPKDVVFQANFQQGSGVYIVVYDDKLQPTYFCYSSYRWLYE